MGDGRFHLESVMIQNPKIPAFQYNPYSRHFTSETYGYELMIKNRENAINLSKSAQKFGLILGTLGRQGNNRIYEVGLKAFFYIFKDLEEKLKSRGKDFIKVLLSEIFANKLELFDSVDR